MAGIPISLLLTFQNQNQSRPSSIQKLQTPKPSLSHIHTHIKMRKNNDEQQLRDAKRAYKEAKEVGNRAEEARWANYIGNIHKNRGEYVQALKWHRIDYDVSSNFLPDKQLLPTCNTLGELYLRLQDFKDALKIQVIFCYYYIIVLLESVVP